MSIERDNYGGWRFPTPHEAFTLVFVIIESVRESGAFAPTSGMGRVMATIAAVCAVVGVAAARSHISPRIRSILEERDQALLGSMQPKKEE